jgi:nucleoid DNA-binding protein
MNKTGKSKAGREELTSIVQQTLNLETKKQADNIITNVIRALQQTLLNNLASDRFELKLGGFGKFSVRHKQSIRRKIRIGRMAGQVVTICAKRKVKFVALGDLRQRERATES